MTEVSIERMWTCELSGLCTTNAKHTTRDARLCETKCQVQHVILFVGRLGQSIKDARLEDYVARRACNRALARALEFNVFAAREVKQRLAYPTAHRNLRAVAHGPVDGDGVLGRQWFAGRRRRRE